MKMNEGTTKKAKFSVAIPAYNEQNYIRKCLESLAAQTYSGPIELIVCLNACTDKTEDIVRDFIRERNIDLKMVYESRKGVAWARQRAFSVASGDYICSADADAQYPPDWIERIAMDFQADPEIVEVYGPVHLKDFNGYAKIFSWTCSLINSLATGIGRLLGCENTSGANLAVRKVAFENIGGFNTSLRTLEDGEITRRLKNQGLVFFDPKLIVHASARRYNKLGLLRASAYYLRNYIKIFLLGRASEELEDVRI